MTYDELKDQVARLSQKLDAVQVDDVQLLELKIQLRQLQNQMDIASVPSLGAQTLGIDVDALIAAVDQDITRESARTKLLGQVGQLIGFVRQVIA